MRPLISLLLLASTLSCVAVPDAWAATGSIKFQQVDVSLSNSEGRVQSPVIVVSNASADGAWQVADADVTFKLKVVVDLNSGSKVTNIWLGIPAIGLSGDSWSVYSTPAKLSAQKVVLDPVRRNVSPRNMALTGTGAALRCAEGARAGLSGSFRLPFDIDAQIEVEASRGAVNVETRRKLFNRVIRGEVLCNMTAQSVAEPQRTPGAPKRVPGDPKRTLLPFRPLSAELGFARAGNTSGCPAEIRQSIRVTSQGPGTAKVYIMRQGDPTVGAPVLVDVSTPNGNRFVGVHQKNIRLSKSFVQTYRLVVANPLGPAVQSSWATLDVRC